MILGHEKQKEILEKAISLGNLPHAIMLEGYAGLGKKKLITYLFKKNNCQEKEPCNKCQTCLAVNQNSHPDFISIQLINNEIKISQIRDLIHKASLKPYSSDSKWIIIDNAHLMNQEASNALLKELEEPKDNTIFFLITNYPDMIYNTIKSRVQTMKFFPISNEKIQLFLEKKGCDSKKAQEISLFSFGRPGLAIDFFLNKKDISFRRKKIKELAEITSPQKPFHLRFKYAKNISENVNEAQETLEIWLSYLRIMLLEKIKNNEVNCSFRKIINSLNLIEKTIYLITKTNTNPRLLMEVLLINL